MSASARLTAREQAGIVLADADAQRLRIVGHLRHDVEIGRLPGEPRGHRIDLHHRRDAARGEVDHGVLDAVERVDPYAADLAFLLHPDGDVVVGGRRLHAHRGQPEVGDAADLRRASPVDHDAEGRGHVGHRPGQRLLALRRDGDAAHDDVVLAGLHLLQDRLPLRVDEYRGEREAAGDLVHEIDLEADPLAVRHVLERRIHEVGADAQGSRRQRAQGLGLTARAGAKSQHDACQGAPRHASHGAPSCWSTDVSCRRPRRRRRSGRPAPPPRRCAAR